MAQAGPKTHRIDMSNDKYRWRSNNFLTGLIRLFKAAVPEEWLQGRKISITSRRVDILEQEAGGRKIKAKYSAQQFISRSSFSEQLCNSDDADFWWFSTAPILQTLMIYAKYNDQRVDDALQVYDEYVVGSLGPRPGQADGAVRWKSFMTDDFTPIEFSWNWGPARKIVEPTIRFSIEPISMHAGLPCDLWNLQASVSLLERLNQDLPNLDISVFDSLKDNIKMMTRNPPNVPTATTVASPSSMFLAFELEGKEPMIKAYMQPFRCASSEKPCRVTTTEFLESFAKELQWHSLLDLLEFLQSDGERLGIEPFMIAFDCVPFLQTRMKIYVRSQDTSFTGVCKVMSLFQDTNTIGTALDDLKKLWKHVFTLGHDFDPDAPLSNREHETAGILYYLEVRPHSKHVTLKVYLPLKHYAVNDLSAAQGLANFLLEMRGEKSQEGDAYLSALREICVHRKLEDGSGLQTYLSCAIKNGELDITSYLNPEIYHPGRCEPDS